MYIQTRNMEVLINNGEEDRSYHGRFKKIIPIKQWYTIILKDTLKKFKS